MLYFLTHFPQWEWGMSCCFSSHLQLWLHVLRKLKISLDICMFSISLLKLIMFLFFSIYSTKGITTTNRTSNTLENISN